jgi:ribosomal protein S18 acetylase RimI-like enzyme
VRLRPMTDEEFANFAVLNEDEYAHERARAFRTPLGDEQAAARQQIAQLLKDGMHTSGHRFWRAELDDGTTVGSLWAFVDLPAHRAFIYYIRIDDAERGKGYGKQVMDEPEAKLAPFGIERIALNVFAPNQVARNLYEKQGYHVTNYQMQKEIGR